MKKITLLTLLALVLSAPICTASNLRVKVNTYGELADAVGDRLNEIDSIWVEGPIDSTDIRALWNASFHGKLVYINLSTATAAFEGDCVARRHYGDWQQCLCLVVA